MAEALTTPGAGSERVRLARTALGAALLVPGVRAGDAGLTQTHFTAAGKGERLDGVVCVADPGGGYDISLQLVCEAVPLTALSAQIRRSVNAAVRGAGLEHALARLSVHFSDLAIGVETA